MNQLNFFKELIDQGDVEEAIQAIDTFLPQATNEEKEQAYYLRGNAYRKLSDWQRAMNSYQHAIDLNPDSPACQAREMLSDILSFYNKDMYNQ
ncbi:MAG: tetratricopeptide repeat protein [Bacteroides sp.]|nr:tetratricopeptide repeat protein [Bacteroides sp.]